MGSQRKADLLSRILRVFAKTKSVEMMQETLNFLWNILQYPKENFYSDKNIMYNDSSQRNINLMIGIIFF